MRDGPNPGPGVGTRQGYAGGSTAVQEYTAGRRVANDPEQLFDLVSDIERYPDFVPGYRAAKILRREGARLEVRQTVSVLGWKSTFDSIARLDPPRALEIDASPPGFRRLHILWELKPEDQGDGTRISVTVRYEPAGLVPRAVSRRWVRALAEMQIQAFLDRARSLEPAP